MNYEDVEALIGAPPFGKKHLIEQAEFEESVRKDAGDPEPITKDTKANSSPSPPKIN